MEKTYYNALSAINTLVETCRFSEKGYLKAAENIGLSQLKTELTSFAHQRAGFRQELEKYAGNFSSSKSLETSKEVTSDKLQRGWVNLNYVVTTNNKAILSACETGDSVALKTYETIMCSPEIPQEVKKVMMMQRDEIEETQNAVSSLKDSIL